MTGMLFQASGASVEVGSAGARAVGARIVETRVSDAGSRVAIRVAAGSERVAVGSGVLVAATGWGRN
jgi:hypothetical protein